MEYSRIIYVLVFSFLFNRNDLKCVTNSKHHVICNLPKWANFAANNACSMLATSLKSCKLFVLLYQHNLTQCAIKLRTSLTT